MARKNSSQKRKIVNTLLSFLLSFLLFVLTIMLIMQAVIFNRSTMINTINESGYIQEKNQEIISALKNSSNNIGLDDSFFNGLIEDSLIHRDTVKYIENYYSDSGSDIDATDFKEKLNKSINNYIVRNNIDKSTISKSDRELFVNNASEIYKTTLEMPLLNTYENYFVAVKNYLPTAMLVAGISIVAICIIIFIESKWKHRACKYHCYATTTVALATAIPAIVLIITGVINKLNIPSVAANKVFIALGNSMNYMLIYFSVFYAIVSIALYCLYRYYRSKRSSRL